MLRDWLAQTDTLVDIKFLSGLFPYRRIAPSVVDEWLRPRDTGNGYAALEGEMAGELNLRPYSEPTVIAPESADLLAALAAAGKRLDLQIITVATPLAGYLREQDPLFTAALQAMRRERTVSFAAIEDHEVLVHFGITRRQAGSIKLGHAERATPPKIGIFGNHQVKHFSVRDFGLTAPPDQFFNYWYAESGLPEVRDYLAHLARLDKLPSETVLVHITTPNNDNGSGIINLGNELPLDIRLGAVRGGHYGPVQSVAVTGYMSYNVIRQSLRIYSLAAGAFKGYRLIQPIDPNRCDATDSITNLGFLGARLPPSILYEMQLVDEERLLCSFIAGSYRADGSVTLPPKPYSPSSNSGVRENDRGLSAGDDALVAAYMRDITEIVTGAGRKLAFLIPPVFEEPRESVVNRLFDKALARLGDDVVVIDHRRKAFSKENFVLFDHPSDAYFRELVGELRHLNLAD